MAAAPMHDFTRLFDTGPHWSPARAPARRILCDPAPKCALDYYQLQTIPGGGLKLSREERSENVFEKYRR